MKKIKNIITIILSLFLFSSIFSAETIIDVDIQPAQPVAGSQITITVDISSENKIDKVYLEIQECKEDLCFTKENITMNLINNVYKTTYKLTKTEATYFKYSFSIKFDNGQWYETEKTDVILKANSNNDGTNGGNGGDNKSPGFEIIFLIIAVSLIILLFKRKRLR